MEFNLKYRCICCLANTRFTENVFVYIKEYIRYQVEEKERQRAEELLRHHREQAEEEAQFRALRDDEIIRRDSARERARKREVRKSVRL